MDNGGFMGYETREGINENGEIMAEDTTKCAWNRKAGIEYTPLKKVKKRNRENKRCIYSQGFSRIANVRKSRSHLDPPFLNE